MIIIGGERPNIDDPNPLFGGLLSSLNNLRFKIEKAVEANDNENQENLNYLANVLEEFIKNNIPIDKHIALTGPVHGETVETVKLELVDNFRTATDQDIKNKVNNAFVTPKGVNTAIKNSISGFNIDDFQQNVKLPLALIHYIDQFQRADKDVGAASYFKKAPATLIMNGDRVIVSPQYTDGFKGPYSLFYSDTVKMQNAIGLNEERQVAVYYNGTGWNMKGAGDTVNKIGIFRPLANKGIYDYNNNIPVTGNKYVVLSSTFGDISHKGCLISCGWSNNQIQWSHYFFGVNNPESDPTLTQIIDGTYKATYNTINTNNVSDNLNKTRTFNLSDFFTLGAGVSVTVQLPNGAQPTVSADWRILNREFLMNFSIPVLVKIGDQTFNKIFTFTESVRPGKLVIADTAAISSLYANTKDSILTVADLTNSKWLVDNDPTNLLNMVSCPGVINTNGLIINGYTSRTALRLKITQSNMDGIIPLLEKPGQVLSNVKGITQTFVPTRHFSFGDLPERILPISQDDSQTLYLSYCLAVDKNQFKYKELYWTTGSIFAQNATTKQYAVSRPDVITERDIANVIPSSLMCLANSTGGVNVNALALTTANNFKGYSSFQYNNGNITLGNEVTLSLQAQTILNLHLQLVKGNSVNSPAYADGIEKYNQSFSMGVFTVANNKALVYWSDGLSYIEAVVVPFSVTGGKLNLTMTMATQRFVVTKNTQANKGSRASKSGDDLQLRHSDLLVYTTSVISFRFVLNRPFGELNGDVSFVTSNFTSPVVSLNPENTFPAPTYDGLSFFDLAEEHYPVCLIPKAGVFQNTSNTDTQTVLTRIGGVEVFDPYAQTLGKVVLIPEGFRCVLNGTGRVIDEAIEIMYDTIPAYFYLEENVGVINLKSYPVQQKPDNNAVMVGYDSDGTGVRYTRSYIVLDKHLISSERKGSTIPLIVDDGTVIGSTDFFRYKDVIRDK